MGILQTRAVRDRGEEVKSRTRHGSRLAAVPALIAFLFDPLNYLLVYVAYKTVSDAVYTHAEHSADGHGLLGVRADYVYIRHRRRRRRSESL